MRRRSLVDKGHGCTNMIPVAGVLTVPNGSRVGVAIGKVCLGSTLVQSHLEVKVGSLCSVGCAEANTLDFSHHCLLESQALGTEGNGRSEHIFITLFHRGSCGRCAVAVAGIYLDVCVRGVTGERRHTVVVGHGAPVCQLVNFATEVGLILYSNDRISAALSGQVCFGPSVLSHLSFVHCSLEYPIESM